MRPAARLELAPEPPAHPVEAHEVVKSFGAKVALDGVSLRVEPGQFVVLLGPSGSGNTTLLRCVAGIERVDAGTIAIAGRRVAGGRLHLPPDRRGLAMVFQDYALWPHMTAERNVAYALRRRPRGPGQARDRARAMLERVGLGGMFARYPNELSGGEQQRVALARALVGNPSLLLFDEPLSNLDANLREQLRVEIGTLVRESGASALYITHDQAEAFALGDLVGVLRGGRLEQFDEAEAVYTRPATPFVARFTGVCGELQGRAGAAALPGLRTVEVLGARLAVRPGAGCSPGEPVRVLARASAVSLHPPGTAPLVGTVRDVAFRGRGYDHLIELPDGTRLTGVHDEARRERGAAVGVRLAAEGAFAFPEASAVSAEGAS